MAMVSAVLGLVGSVVSAAGAMQAASAQKASADYAAQVADNNATIANQNAELARQEGRQQADIASREAAAKLAEIRVAEAASGVDVNSGSALDVQAGQRQTSKLDTDTKEWEGEKVAYGYTTQAVNFKAQAEQDRISGQNAQAAGGIAAVGDIFGGLGNFASSASSIGFNWGGGGGSTGGYVSGGVAPPALGGVSTTTIPQASGFPG